MGERIILVCDVCGQPATETVTLKVGGRNLTKDLCQKHVSELASGARPTRRGRRRQLGPVAGGIASAGGRGTTGSKSTAKASSTRASRKKSA